MPTKLVDAWRCAARDGGKVVVHIQPHHHRNSVPAARYEAIVTPRRSLNRIHMHRLRIELSRERDDIDFLNEDRSALMCLALDVVLQIAIVDWSRKGRHYRHIPSREPP